MVSLHMSSLNNVLPSKLNVDGDDGGDVGSACLGVVLRHTRPPAAGTMSDRDNKLDRRRRKELSCEKNLRYKYLKIHLLLEKNKI